jgi:hypothetical protein
MKIILVFQGRGFFRSLFPDWKLVRLLSRSTARGTERKTRQTADEDQAGNYPPVEDPARHVPLGVAFVARDGVH